MTATLEQATVTTADQEEALLAELAARASVVLPDPATIEEAQAQLEQRTKAVNEFHELRRKLDQAQNDAAKKLEELKQAAEKKTRWRMYQVWRMIDDGGYTDWTPSGKYKESYAIKEVGQVIDFKANNDCLNMCRSGTHMARFAYEAACSYNGNRLVRLELEGWVNRSSYFICETAKVLAILDINDLMGLGKAADYVEDNRGQALRRYLEADSPAYIDPTGGSTGQQDRWRQHLIEHYWRPLVEKTEADEAYRPTPAEMQNIILMAEKAGLNDFLFAVTLRYPDSDSSLMLYLERAVTKSRELRAAAVGRTTVRGSTSPAQQKMQRTDRKELEVQVRAYVKEHYPDVVIKDFGVSRGRDALDPGATSSPKYWLDN